jgi:hypothetical protein
LRSEIRTTNGLKRPVFLASAQSHLLKKKIGCFVFWLKFDEMDHHTNTLIMGFWFCFVLFFFSCFLVHEPFTMQWTHAIVPPKKVIVVKFFSYNNLSLVWGLMFSKLVVERTKD